MRKLILMISFAAMGCIPIASPEIAIGVSSIVYAIQTPGSSQASIALIPDFTPMQRPGPFVTKFEGRVAEGENIIISGRARTTGLWEMVPAMAQVEVQVFGIKPGRTYNIIDDLNKRVVSTLKAI